MLRVGQRLLLSPGGTYEASIWRGQTSSGQHVLHGRSHSLGTKAPSQARPPDNNPLLGHPLPRPQVQGRGATHLSNGSAPTMMGTSVKGWPRMTCMM